MNGGAPGLFSVERTDDVEAMRHIVTVRCDLCRDVVTFDERKFPRPILELQRIAREHTCKRIPRRRKLQKREVIEPDNIRENVKGDRETRIQGGGIAKHKFDSRRR